MRELAGRLLERVAGELDEAAGERAGGGERDLLAEYRADRELAAIDGARHPKAGPGGDERAEDRVAREVRVGRGRVGAEEARDGVLGGGPIVRVGGDDVRVGSDLDHRRPVREPHGAAEGAGGPRLLDPGDRAGGQECRQGLQRLQAR